jgi:hypothetical protein
MGTRTGLISSAVADAALCIGQPLGGDVLGGVGLAACIGQPLGGAGELPDEEASVIVGAPVRSPSSRNARLLLLNRISEMGDA